MTIEPIDELAKAALDEADLSIRPTSKGAIGRMLDKVALVLRAQVPEAEALEVYFYILRGYPEDVIKRAGLTICATHHYPTFPLPADFVRVIEADETYQQRKRDYHRLRAAVWKIGYVKRARK